MNRKWIRVGAFLALGIALYVGRLLAQSGGTPAAASAPLRTRIAVLNMAYVMKYYKKAESFNNEMKGYYKPYEDNEKRLKGQLDVLANQLRALTTPGAATETKREELARQAKDINRAIEDNAQAAKRELGKKSEEQVKILYKDVYEATWRFARGHDYEMVLQFADAFTTDDYWNPRLLERKLGMMGVMPLYMAPGMDISMEVVNLLNDAMPKAAAAPSAGTPPGGG